MSIPTQLIPLVVPNTDTVIVTEKRHITRIGGTKDLPLIWIRGISRAFHVANSRTLPAHRNPGTMLNEVPTQDTVETAAGSPDGLPDSENRAEGTD